MAELTEAERAAQRKRRTLIAIAVVVLVPTLAMVAANHMASDVPPPLWTEEALPLPAEESNGWPAIAHYHSTTISGINLEPIENLLSAAARNKAPLAELNRLFAPARVVAGKVGEHNDICRKAFERERMVLPCLEVDAKACSTEPVKICGRLVSFAALDRAARGSAEGGRLMAMVLRQLTDVAANSRHPWVQARAMVMLRDAIHHAGTIIKWRRIPTKALRDALAAISDETLPPSHLAIASYLLKHKALREAMARTDTWLLDEGGIIAGLNRPFAPVKDGGELLPPPDYKDGAFWWFVNPVGKKMLDAVSPGADEDYLKAIELRKKAMKRRDEALKLRH